MAAVCVLLAAVSWTPLLVAQNDNQPKLTDAQRKEIQAIDEMIAGVTASQPGPNDLSLKWIREDALMRVPENRQYVPFIVSIDPAAVTEKELVVYWRVVAKAGEAEPDQDKRDNQNQSGSRFAYEDMNSARVESGQSGSQTISRSFAVPPGEYDVHVVIKEPTSTRRNAPAPKTSYLTHTVTVPDFWNGDLTTSSVIVAKSIEPLAAPLTPQQQAERPYALGSLEILPADDDSFTKAEELQTFMLIYNAKMNAQNKPDVAVEYNFYVKEGGAEKYFNKTNPQELNASTLPPEFDMALGHQLQSGQAVPLASFPEGEYRLEIKVTDKVANASMTREVNFTVAGS